MRLRVIRIIRDKATVGASNPTLGEGRRARGGGLVQQRQGKKTEGCGG